MIALLRPGRGLVRRQRRARALADRLGPALCGAADRIDLVAFGMQRLDQQQPDTAGADHGDAMARRERGAADRMHGRHGGAGDEPGDLERHLVG